MSNRKKVTLAIVGSILLHVVIILAISGVFTVWPQTEVAGATPSQEQLPEMTLLDQPAPKAPEHNYVRTEDEQKTEQKPVDTMFESDKDTAAASEKPAEAGEPVPTQDGKKLPDMAFLNHDYSLDTKGPDFNQKPDQPEAQQPESTPTPTPTPTATPEASPPKADELAMAPPPPTPAPSPPPANQRPQRQKGAPRTAYRQQSMLNQMRGNITNRGRSSVAALGTPWGRFQKAISDAVGSRWYFYINAQGGASVMPDSVQVNFRVLPDGRVTNVHVIGSPSNQTLASCSLRAVSDAQIPPMPEELISTMPPDGTEVTFTFTLYLN
jgi:outer membrane biosynthesis protein TonB